MNLPIYKIIAVLGGGITAFLMSLPPDAHRAAGVAVWFVILDVASGVVAARIKGPINSRSYRMGIKDKLVCYATIIGLALGFAVLTGAMSWYSYAWWGVCSAEAFSLIENLRVMLRQGGASMLPLARFLDLVASYIEKLTGQREPIGTAPVASVEATPAPVPTAVTTPEAEGAQPDGSTTDPI